MCPLLPPLQDTFTVSDLITESRSAKGWVITITNEVVQRWASLIDTVYVPANILEAELVVLTLGAHMYE